MCVAVLAKRMGMTVFSSSRSKSKEATLKNIGVDHVLVDDGNLAKQVRNILPDGVDCAIELIGTPTLPDTLKSVKVKGTVCFTGMLSNIWTVKEFYPIGTAYSLSSHVHFLSPALSIEYLPTGVRL